jgi:hypothetical protein
MIAGLRFGFDKQDPAAWSKGRRQACTGNARSDDQDIHLTHGPAVTSSKGVASTLAGEAFRNAVGGEVRRTIS